MKPILLQHLAVSTTAALNVLFSGAPAIAATFGQKEVDQSQFVVVAAPIGTTDSYKLLILEQISDERDCWRESGANPTVVDPLLLSFDFSGICRRYTDSNGYSIRMDGQDKALEYNLRVVRQDNDVVLLGVEVDDDETDADPPELAIGSTNGIAPGFLKINLDPRWRLTRRTFENKALGHVYMTRGGAAFSDIANDIYAEEITAAVNLGFIAGFEDNTFRPTATLTREQLVSMVVEALNKQPNIEINVPSQVSSSPFSDVEPSRWSAAKIQFAQANNIVSGYGDGRFRPTQPVTRAELIAVLRRAAEFSRSRQGLDTTLPSTQEPQSFGDTAGHWANSVVQEMSAYCGVASPLSEQGNQFRPDTAAQRNYAAAATLRMLQCSPGEATQAS